MLCRQLFLLFGPSSLATLYQQQGSLAVDCLILLRAAFSFFFSGIHPCACYMRAVQERDAVCWCVLFSSSAGLRTLDVFFCLLAVTSTAAACIAVPLSYVVL